MKNAYLPLFFVLHSLCFGAPSPDVDTPGEFQGRLKANLMLSGERAVPNTEVEPGSFSDIARSIIMREYPFAGGILCGYPVSAYFSVWLYRCCPSAFRRRNLHHGVEST